MRRSFGRLSSEGLEVEPAQEQIQITKSNCCEQTANRKEEQHGNRHSCHVGVRRYLTQGRVHTLTAGRHYRMN